MSLTVEQVLNDAKRLVEKLREHDSAADTLIEQTSTLHKKIDAMKQYQEEVEEMNQVARHRPRSSLILGIQQENRQIRELQRENKDLRLALDEHQSALELIMSSYREQVSKLVLANRTEQVAFTTNIPCEEKSQNSGYSAVTPDNDLDQDQKAAVAMEEMMARLLIENRGLREMLEISRRMHSSHTKILEDNENSKDDNKNVKEKNDNDNESSNANL